MHTYIIRFMKLGKSPYLQIEVVNVGLIKGCKLNLTGGVLVESVKQLFATVNDLTSEDKG